MNLNIEDKTPEDFHIQDSSILNKLKEPIRKFLYPTLAKIKGLGLEKSLHLKEKLNCDMVFSDQRGNDYEAHRARVNKYKDLQNSVILLIGIGTGRDLESWLKYNPKKIIAIDYFNYKRAWDMRTDYYSDKYDTELEFIQTDILNMNMINDNSIDIIGSDAVFEHINKFDEAMMELNRVLTKGGLLYATFGPLWHSWGGDHISGTSNLYDGYNHIKLSKEDYDIYLDSFGDFSHKEDDGRTWIKNNLFSYLKPKEYIESIENIGLTKRYSSVIHEPRAILYMNQFPNEFNELKEQFELENLLITGMTIIYDK